MNENKTNQPIEFMDKAGATNEAEKMKRLMDALMFGVPVLGQFLSDMYEKSGLDGLRDIQHTFEKYAVISMIVNDEVDVDINELLGDNEKDLADPAHDSNNNTFEDPAVTSDKFNAEEW